VQGLKAAATLLAAASLCALSVLPAAARQMPLKVAWEDLRLKFVGNRVFRADELRRVAELCYGERSDGEEFDAKLLDSCLKTKVVDAMRYTGFLRAQVSEGSASSLGNVLTVTVRVEENEFFRMGQVKIVGASHFDVKSLRELLPLKRGDVVDGLAVERWAFEHLKQKYVDEGFMQYEAGIEPAYRVAPGAAEGVVDLTVTVNEGKRFILRSLTFEGDAGAPVDVMRELLGLKEGEVFKQQELIDGVRELNSHELFDWQNGRYEDLDPEKDVEPRVDEEAGALDIKIHLTGKGQERAARPGAEQDEGRPGRPTLKRRP
jgi:outer membrane protein assembly factor BamA